MKDGSKIPVPCSSAASTSLPARKMATSSVAGGSTATTTTTISASRARRPSTLQYCLKSTAPRLAPPPPTPPTRQPDDDRPTSAPEHEAAPAGDRTSTTVPPRQPAAVAGAPWPTRIVAPKATPEDSLIDSCSTDDGEEGPEYRLLSLAGDEIGDHHLRATANTSHLDLLNRRVSAPIADEDDDDDVDVDDEFDLGEGRPVELCRDELPPPSTTAAAGGSPTEEASSPDPFRYVDVLAARTVNSCDATGFPRRRPWPPATATRGEYDRFVGSSGTSLPGRLSVGSSPRHSSRSSTLLRHSICSGSGGDSSETLTPAAASARGSLSGIAAAATASTLTAKRSRLFASVGGGAVGGDGSAGRLSAPAAAAADSPTRDASSDPLYSPDSPVSRFCHLGAHALDVFYSPGDDDDGDEDDAGVVSPLPAASTLASGAGTFWRPVACTAAVDRRRRPVASPPSLSQLIQRRSPTTVRRPRLSSPPPPPPTLRPSAAPLVGVIEGLSDVECSSTSDDEDNSSQASTIRPQRPTGQTPAHSAADAAAQLSETELQQSSSRSCSKHEEVSGGQSTWLTMPAESSALHREGHSPATDIVWPAETLRPRYYSVLAVRRRLQLRFDFDSAAV